jgi:hypothetical protein
MLSFNTFRDLHDKITSIISPEHTQIWGGIDLVTTQGSWERFGEPRSQSITCTPFLPVPMEPSCHTLYDQVFSVMEIRNCVAFHFRLFLPAPFVFFILHIGLLSCFVPYHQHLPSKFTSFVGYCPRNPGYCPPELAFRIYRVLPT